MNTNAMDNLIMTVRFKEHGTYLHYNVKGEFLGWSLFAYWRGV